MFSSQVLLQFSLLLLQLWVKRSSGICPGDSYSSKIPLYFGYMAAVDPTSSFNSAGTIPAVDLALQLINNNDSLLYGYTLSYNGTIYDSKVSIIYVVLCCAVLEHCIYQQESTSTMFIVTSKCNELKTKRKEGC